jgi:hypothetical protein
MTLADIQSGSQKRVYGWELEPLDTDPSNQDLGGSDGPVCIINIQHVQQHQSETCLSKYGNYLSYAQYGADRH